MTDTDQKPTASEEENTEAELDHEEAPKPRPIPPRNAPGGKFSNGSKFWGGGAFHSQTNNPQPIRRSAGRGR